MQGLGHWVYPEKLHGSSLIRSTAIEVHTSWDHLNAKLTTLETNITRYNDLVILLCKSADEVTATETKIDESIVQLEEYISKVGEVRITDIVAFIEIKVIVNPPPEITSDTQRQGQSNQQGPVIFKPEADLKPRLLQRDCNLKEEKLHSIVQELYAVRVFS